MLRRTVSVVVGLVAVLLLVGVTVAILAEIFPTQFRNADGSYVFPGSSLVVFSMVYSFASAGAGGYLTASIASRSPLAHAVALGAVLVLISAIFVIIESVSTSVVVSARVLGADHVGIHRRRFEDASHARRRVEIRTDFVVDGSCATWRRPAQ